MKILLAVQSTGNGHLARARELLPHFKANAEVDVLVSGGNGNLDLEQQVKYNFDGLSFSCGKDGRIDFLKTVSKIRYMQFLKAVRELPCEQYDLIVSDFEPISAWASKKSGTHCIALSHQASFLSQKSPRPDSSGSLADIQCKLVGEMIFKKYAPADSAIGFHFENYDSFIHTPVIRQEIRSLVPCNKGHITVYLPAYGDERLVELLRLIPDKKFHVFNKHSEAEYEIENIHVQPINNGTFLKSFESSDGILTGAGFQSSAEALFLGKKLFVIPMIGQYEQLCNVAALSKLGVPYAKSLSESTLSNVKDWATNGKAKSINFPDRSKQIVEEILNKHSRSI